MVDADNMLALDDDYINRCLAYLYTHQRLLTFVKDFNEPGGFLWCADPCIYELDDVLNMPGYSPTAFAVYLRLIQTILQREAA
jgi:hypothetical protein